MKKNLNLKLIVSLTLMVLLSLIPKYSFAAFSLSVTPYEGGYDLRFGKVGMAFEPVRREVNVGITTDIGKQYEVIQRFLEPLTNAEGVSLSGNNFTLYGIRGTNLYGTLRVEEIPVSLGESIIYTSNQQGTPDSFTLVYSLKGPFNVPQGSYRGRISFTLRPIDATQQPVTVILNIFAEIEVVSSIEIKTVTGTKIISLDSSREETKTFDVFVDIKGGVGSQFVILQSLLEPLKTTEAEELPYETVNFMIRDVKKGNGPMQPTPLSLRPDVVYTSSPTGEPDSFIITYSLTDDIEKLKAGRYKSKIRYTFKGLLEEKLIDIFDLEVEIAKVFDITVKLQEGTKIEFADLKPSGPAKTYEVLIEVKTNVGKQYQVTQRMPTELVSKEGYVIMPESFTLRTEGEAVKGILKFLEKTPVKKGDTVLFVSDKEGSLDTFKVIYELKPSSDTKLGDYSTTVSYSLSEI